MRINQLRGIKMISQKYLFPISICWDITGKCNEECKFCYRVRSNSDLSVEDNFKILQKLIDGGVKKISIVGGEPLLYDGFIDIIEVAKKAGVITSLTTNGKLLDKKKLDILSNILNWLSLPLDSCDTRIQCLMTRSKGHFENVIRILEDIKENEYLFNVKLNSVATKINKDTLPNIADLINRYNIKRWKIFQYFPIRGEADKNKNLFSISKTDFDRLKDMINNKRSLIPDCMVSFSDITQLQETYLSISPDGSARVSFKNNDVILGNLLENHLYDLWNTSFINKNMHFERNKWIFERPPSAFYLEKDRPKEAYPTSNP